MTSIEPGGPCPVCDGSLAAHRHAWLLRCAHCKFLCSRLEPRLNAAKALEEDRRAEALHDIRRRNFAVVLDLIRELRPHGRLLDVGCGHGWFLQQAAGRGYRGVGIEPDLEIAAVARSHGGEIRTGLFPAALGDGETFDVIAFNDVLEHMPNVSGVLRAARAHLRQDGLLVINLPLSSGVFYRIADLLDRIGIAAPFARMWQINFPSPHLSYFNAGQLIGLARRQGFRCLKSARLPSLTWNGLWQRLRYDRSQGILGAALLWLLLTPMVPILRLLPPDIGVFVFAADHVEAGGNA
jgi:SAM-dependent methyltransferase